MSGQRREAYDASGAMRAVYSANLSRPDAPGTDQGWNAALTSRVRFGDWAGVLGDVDGLSEAQFPYAAALRHYARGLALLHVRAANVTAARGELDELRRLRPRVAADFDRLVAVANLTLTAALALAPGGGGGGGDSSDGDGGIEMLRAAADAQNGWHYDEPPNWPKSARRTDSTQQVEGERESPPPLRPSGTGSAS